MTVSSSTSRNEYNGNAVTTIFAYTFRILDQDHVAVYVGSVLKTITTDYTVSGVGVSSGGSITFTTAPASGTGNVVIIRSVPLTQETDYVENDPFPAESHEDALDKLTMIAQQINSTLERSLRQSAGEAANITELPLTEDRASKFLAFDSLGNPIASAGGIPESSINPYPVVLSGTRFVFVGDSKTDGPTDATAYPYYFSQLATSADLGTVYNLGVSGYTLANLITNYTANVKIYAPGQSSNLTSIPTVLSVWIGANDLYQLISAGYTDGADYYNDLATYVNTAIADGFRVMMWTIDARGDHVDGTTEFYRASINAAIRHNTQATWIVDPETVFWDYTDTTWWLGDTIHYVAAGYERLAKLIAQTLLSGGAPGELNSPKINKTNTWSKPQAFTGGTSYMSGAAGSARGWYFMTNLVARFFAYISAGAEGGSDAGSDFCLDRFSDAGALLETETLKIKRSNGKLTYKGEAVFIGGLGTAAVRQVVAATYTFDSVAPDFSVIMNWGAAMTVTLPNAATYPGRMLRIKNVTAFTVVSASSNVCPIGSVTAGTAILAATAGKFAELQSDGANWHVMAGA